jgi:hypothetical protein
MRVGDPYEEEFGWSVEVTVGYERYELFVQWFPTDAHPENCWSIEIRPLRGLLGWLLPRRQQHFGHLLGVISRILNSTDGITEVRWMTRVELSKVK